MVASMFTITDPVPVGTDKNHDLPPVTATKLHWLFTDWLTIGFGLEGHQLESDARAFSSRRGFKLQWQLKKVHPFVVYQNLAGPTVISTASWK